MSPPTTYSQVHYLSNTRVSSSVGKVSGLLPSHPGSTPTPVIADNILGQDMNLIDALPYQGEKLVLAGNGSECCVVTKLTFIKFIPCWILFSCGNLDTL